MTTQQQPSNVNGRAAWGVALIVLALIVFAAYEYVQGIGMILALIAFVVGIAMILPALILKAAKMVRAARR